MVYRLYDAKREPKQLKVFEGSQHAMSFDDNKEEYTQLVKSFVNKYTPKHNKVNQNEETYPPD